MRYINGGAQYEIELFDLYSELLDSYRQISDQPKEIIGVLIYKSEDSQVTMYSFDQESYQKFKDYVVHIPQATPVRLHYHYGESANRFTGKVLVVKSGVNGKIHEVPTIDDWYYTKEMIYSTIPEYFFPCQFVYEAPGHYIGFHDRRSWYAFQAFATHEDNRGQRYFEVSAGKGSIKEQILSCRRDYANLVLPLMRQHQAVFLDQSLTPEDKLEKMVALTKQMANLESGCTKHRKAEEKLRNKLDPSEKNENETNWSKLYDLEQTFIKEVDEGDFNDHGTYWNEDLVKYYNTDSTEMLPIIEQELLFKEHQH